MYRLPLAVRLDSFRLPLRKGLIAAAQLGVEGVEIDPSREFQSGDLTPSAVREMRHLLAEADVTVSAVRFRSRRGFASQDGLDRRIDAARRSLKLAADLGARIVTCGIGDIPSESDELTWTLLNQVLTDLGNYGNRLGATLTAETSAAKTADLRRLLTAVPEGTIGVDYDPTQLMFQQESPLEALSLLTPHVRYVHARDAARDFSLRQSVETQLGRGSVDFPAILSALEQSRYRGFLCLTATGADPMTELKQAKQFLRSLG